MLEKLLTLIAPHHCLGCGTEGVIVCKRCGAGLPLVPSCCYRCGRATMAFRTCVRCSKASPLRSVRPRTAYEGLAKDIVWRFKFARAQAAAADISFLMLVPEIYDRACLLVPVPTATHRVRQRGYDQTRLLTRQLAVSWRVPYAPVLARIGQERQVGMSGDARRRQLRGAFRVTRPALVAKKHIILVDDVVTSGATLEAAAAILKQTGAWRIDALVFARA